MAKHNVVTLVSLYYLYWVWFCLMQTTCWQRLAVESFLLPLVINEYSDKQLSHQSSWHTVRVFKHLDFSFYWTSGIEEVTRVDSLKTSHFLGFHTMIDGHFDYLLGFMPPWCLGAQLPNTQSKNSLWDNKHFVHVDFFQ